MKNLLILILLLILLITPIYINHKTYGNSNITISNYEYAEWRIHEYKKRQRAKELADYIYKRILYWQKIKKGQL